MPVWLRPKARSRAIISVCRMIAQFFPGFGDPKWTHVMPAMGGKGEMSDRATFGSKLPFFVSSCNDQLRSQDLVNIEALTFSV